MKKKVINRGGRMSGKSVLKIDDPELSPLKALNNLVERLAIKKYDDKGNLIYWESTADKEYNIIETALKEQEEHKQILNDYGLSLVEFRHACFTFVQFKNSKGFEGIEKSLKALEIIKTKKVNVRCLMSGWSLGKYNSYKAHIKLTQEEYNLLKEVL